MSIMDAASITVSSSPFSIRVSKKVRTDVPITLLRVARRVQGTRPTSMFLAVTIYLTYVSWYNS